MISDCAGGGSGLVDLCLPGRRIDDLKNYLSGVTVQRAIISIFCHLHGRIVWKARYQLIFERGCASSCTHKKSSISAMVISLLLLKTCNYKRLVAS